jgi:predicted DNA-binding ribbon-helix-helix protein
MGLMAKNEKNVASESESEDESDDDEFNQHLACLSKKDKLMVLKLIEKIQEQEETLYNQEEFLINKIKCLEKLTKKHEKFKCSHASLLERYENLSIKQTHTINPLSYVAQLEDENHALKDKVERLTSKNETLQESHDGLLCSHEKLIDSHLILEIAHEVVVTVVKSYQPHTHKCTCTQVPYILSCANNCCSQASQPFVEHVLVETYDDSITKENKEIKEEVERLKRDLIQLKGKCNAQPSQDNHEYMVKKLEKESTEAFIKPHQEGHKSNSGKVRGKFGEV